MDDLARHRVGQRDVGADVEPEPAVGPLRGGRAPRVDDEQPRARVHALQHVMEEDRVRLARVRAPEQDDVRLLDLAVGRLVPPPAPNTVARPTTLGACQVRLQESMLLRAASPGARTSAPGSSSRSSPWSTRRCRTTSSAPASRARPKPVGDAVERLVPGRGAELAVVAYERCGQPDGLPGHERSSGRDSPQHGRWRRRPVKVTASNNVIDTHLSNQLVQCETVDDPAATLLSRRTRPREAFRARGRRLPGDAADPLRGHPAARGGGRVPGRPAGADASKG